MTLQVPCSAPSMKGHSTPNTRMFLKLLLGQLLDLMVLGILLDAGVLGSWDKWWEGLLSRLGKEVSQLGQTLGP